MSAPIDPAAVVAAIRAVVGDAGRVPLHEPVLGDEERNLVAECVESGWVSSAGPFVERFERELARTTGARHAIATVNGTAALHVGLLGCGVAPGDAVVVPALTFVATANAVAHCGAVPHFADSEPRGLGLDPERLAGHLAETTERRGGACVDRRTGRRIAAVVAVHVLGHPADVAGLGAVCERFGLPLVEDAAAAIGTRCGGRHAGTLGRLGTLSFNGNKTITTGGGGAVLTDDDELAARVRHLATTGRLPHRWEVRHDVVAHNHRMPGLNAALGCAQLARLEELLAGQRRLADRYRAALSGLPGLASVEAPPWGTSNWWLSALALDDPAALEPVLAACHEDGLLVRPLWTPMHRLPMYADCPRAALPVAEDLARRLIALPSSATL